MARPRRSRSRSPARETSRRRRSTRGANRHRRSGRGTKRRLSPSPPRSRNSSPATVPVTSSPVTSPPPVEPASVEETAPAANTDPSFIPGSELSFLPKLPRFGGFPLPEDDIKPEPLDPTMGLHRVGGLEEQLKYLNRRVVLPIISRKSLTGLASVLIEPVRGVLFHGPPGTGKTLLAKSLAAELGRRSGQKFSFFMRKGTDVYSKFVGESEQTLRKLFAKAEAIKPSIIFLDELDGLCPVRSDEAHHHTVSVTTTLLGLIDSIVPGNVIIIGATNRLDSLDPAILRPGRFDKHIFMTPPNGAGREAILSLKLEGWGSFKPRPELLRDLARGTSGFTGADLEKLIKEAVDVAMDRQLTQTEPTIHELNKLKVLRSDWLKALGTMSKSNSNVFGNSLYCGEMEADSATPLISGIVETLRKGVAGFFAESELGLQGTRLKSLLVWGPTDPSLTVLDTLILPAVLARLDSKTMPAFILSLDTMPKMVRVIDQALASAQEKSTVLFVPRIDTLYASMVASQQAPGPVLSKLGQVRGKSLLILASGACDLHHLSFQTQLLFHGEGRSLRMGSPSAEERSQFYSPLFSQKAGLQRAVDLTDGDDLWSMMTLHGELAAACVKLDGKQSLGPELERILCVYEKNKLGPNNGSTAPCNKLR